MKKNLYVELRKWLPFWGLGFDSQAEVQKILDEYNERGWHCVQFEKAIPSYKLIENLKIFFVWMITFGFVQKWEGVAFIFERDDSPNFQKTGESTFVSSSNPGTPPLSKLEEWKKKNPHKSINDFYRENS